MYGFWGGILIIGMLHRFVLSLKEMGSLLHLAIQKTPVWETVVKRHRKDREK